MSCLIDGSRNRESVFMKNLEPRLNDTVEDYRNETTFMKAHSFWAARRDMYIHDADFRFPR